MLIPTAPLLISPESEKNKSKKPIDTLGFAKKTLTRENKNPNKIRDMGKSIEIDPKLSLRRSFMYKKPSWLLEKERKSNTPVKIRPIEKIAYTV